MPLSVPKQSCKVYALSSSSSPTVRMNLIIKAGKCGTCGGLLPPTAADLGHWGLWPMHADIVNGYFPLKGGQWLPMFADIANLRDMHGLRFRAAASVEGMVKAKLFAGMDEDTLIPSEITKRPCNDIRQALADYTRPS